MNFLRNSRLISRINFLLAVILTAGNFFYSCKAALSLESDPFNETIRILERWTAAHWGQDCFVWVVHYPEELIAPWVESEALRANMTDSQRENFRKNFISELKLDTSETFLVSVYSFGARPVNLSPVKDNITLLAASGERINPVKFDSRLETPSSGVVQGLVFFPKQSNKNYVISLKGMGRDERIFSFAPPETLPAPEPVNKPEPEVVVVNLPKKQPRREPEKREDLTPPPPPMIPPRPITPIFQETSSDMADFVRSVRERSNNNTPASSNNSPASPSSPTPRQNLTTARPSNIDNAYSSRESVLRRFLTLWSTNSANEMYDMLSDGSRKLISRENFAREIAKSSDMREGLKGDYRINWVGEERAKVITTHKTLIFKSVSTRTLGVTREGSSWKIVW